MPSSKEWQKIQKEEEAGLRASAGVWWGKFEGAKARWHQVITEEFALGMASFKDKRVLEIGGGVYGMIPVLEGTAMSVALEPLSHNFSDLYRDYDPEGQIQRISGAGETLPFKDGSFDVVVLYNVLAHVMAPSRILDECYRVLQSGGILLYDEGAFDRLPRFIRTRLHLVDRLHPFHWNKSELRQLLTNAQFDITYQSHAKGSGLLAGLKWRLKSRRWKAAFMGVGAWLAGLSDYHFIGKR